MVSLVQQHCWASSSQDRLSGRRIAVLGLAYKPDVDDFRESPAVEVAHLLVEAGADVRAFDPYKTENHRIELPTMPTWKKRWRALN